MRSPTPIDPDLLRQLCDQMPFYKVAEHLGLSRCVVRDAARRLGIASKFTPGPEKPGERETFAAMYAAGASISAIAQSTGRSTDFISSRLGAGLHQTRAGRVNSLWPQPTVSPEVAMAGVVFEDAVRRERDGTPILAMRAPTLPTSGIGCAAAMCAGEW